MRAAKLHKIGLQNQYGLYILAVSAGLIGSFLTLAQPIVVGTVIYAMTNREPYKNAIVLLISVFLLAMIFSVVSQLVLGRVSERYVMNLRNTLTSKILHADWRALHSYNKGDIISRIAVDSALSRGWLVGAIPELTSASFVILGCAIGMLLISPALFFASALCILLFGGLSVLFSRGVKKATIRNQQDTAVFIDALHQVTTTIVALKTAILENFNQRRVTKYSERARASGVRAINRSALLGPIMNIGTQVAIATTVVVGGVLLAGNTLSAASLTTYFMYLLYIVSPLVSASSAIGEIASSKAAIHRIKTLSEIQQEPSENTSLSLEKRDSLELEDVVVEMDGKTIIDSVDCQIKGPGLVSIVGPNGAGKSTLLWSLSGLLKPQSGSISFNGIDINYFSTKILRSHICLIPQSIQPFAGSIRDNLQVGDLDIPDEKKWEALRNVGLSNKVRSIPNGLDGILGEGGTELSGGEGQLLALARGLLSEASVFLLDEFTAYVDTAGEELLNSLILKLAQTKLVIVVSHRGEIQNMSDSTLAIHHGKLIPSKKY